MVTAEQVEVVCAKILCLGDRNLPAKSTELQCMRDRVDDSRGDLVLNREDVVERAIECLGPERRIFARSNQLRRETKPRPGSPHACLDHELDAESRRDFGERECLPTKRRRRRS